MDHLREKLAETSRVLDQVLTEFRRPAVLWSGGKDSQVLLFLLRAKKIFCDVVLHREPFLPEKYEFQERMQREWNLRVYDWPPSEVTVQEEAGTVEVVNQYRYGTKLLALPKNLYAPEEGARWLCGLKDLVCRPRGDFAAPWDVLFVGHKASDRDPLLGAVPIESDIVMSSGAPALAFPLRHWTDADIWSYTRAYEVPQQTDRYNVESGEENPDRTTNADYWCCCTKCIDRTQPGTVFCPKLKLNIENVSGQVKYTEPIRPGYMRPEIRSQRSEVGKGKEAHAI